MTGLPPERKVWYGVGDPPYDLTPYRERVASRDADLMWDYVIEWEDEETGEIHDGFWQAILYREKRCSDGSIHNRSITVGNANVEKDWPEFWTALLDMLDAAWQRQLEEAGVTE